MNAVKDDKCEELQVVRDPLTNRKYMTGVGFNEGQLVNLEGKKFVTLKLYFTELSDTEFKRWRKELHSHRNMQEDDMQRRRAKKKK